jgi:hypothetical protein
MYLLMPWYRRLPKVERMSARCIGVFPAFGMRSPWTVVSRSMEPFELGSGSGWHPIKETCYLPFSSGTPRGTRSHVIASPILARADETSAISSFASRRDRVRFLHFPSSVGIDVVTSTEK